MFGFVLACEFLSFIFKQVFVLVKLDLACVACRADHLCGSAIHVPVSPSSGISENRSGKNCRLALWSCATAVSSRLFFVLCKQQSTQDLRGTSLSSIRPE